ncbi:MAG: metal-dependent transcriptional regulator [Flavobacteriales bacterium]|nr:MAG: DtxR family transcriptional regulator [Chlorobi bacterium OLB6]MBE2264855.1 metal-dependent transcriptional regulator [Flavobacteriales bacterium]MBV6462882.1 Diphtheria toxin repressor [Chlorobiota bacterium]MBW7853482.1 metal-dependent transcriptional regulator [Candidatus Kapabacteria bacterium]MCC6331595.1 metal-dependent transcriptional regulator [Ignavibacteria bacterium]
MKLADLSYSIQDYLKIIFLLSESDERLSSAPTSAIAGRLEINPASVTGMLKKLASLHLINYEKHHGARLTFTGRKLAVELVRRHRLLETYLTVALGYSWDEVHDEAEKLEHFISDTLVDRMWTRLGNPQYDPHGDPIPAKDGSIPPVATNRLYNAAVGSSPTVRRVNSDIPDILSALSRHGITIGTVVPVTGRDPRKENVTVSIRGKTIRLDRALADNIFID